MKKALGGDRLGSGKKMDVELHNYGRSTHDLGYIFRSTMSAGTLVPFMSELALPGDTFDINLDCDLKTHPTVGPLFGSYKVQLDIFQCPIRLYQGKLHNNKLGIGMNMAAVQLPIMTLTPNKLSSTGAGGGLMSADLDNSQINPSCILAYLGLRGIGLRSLSGTLPATGRSFNAIPFLAYWDIYKQYYANKQEEIGAVIHTDASEIPLSGFTGITLDGVTVNGWPTVSNPPLEYNQLSVIQVAVTNATAKAENLVLVLEDDPLGNPGVYREQILTNWGDVTAQTATQITVTINVANAGFNGYLAAFRGRTVADSVNREIDIQTFPLENIDVMRENIMAHTGSNFPFELNTFSGAPYENIFQGIEGGGKSIQNSQEGLAIKTYQSDIFNNWLSTEWIDGTNGISEITAIDTTSGSFTIDTLNLSKKVYDMLNRIAVSGGSYDDWLDAVYTHDRYTRCESPMYMGGLIKELVFQEVVSNSSTQEWTQTGDVPTDGAQPLGTLAGKGILGKKHKGGGATVKVDEPSYIIGIISLTPRIDYSQGNKWDMHLKTMDDLHKPALDEIGFQELITEQMAWWDTTQDGTGAWIQKSAGKQPAWLNYMTNHNRIYGNFAIPDNEMFMTLNRRYENEESGDVWQIGDLTTYVDPRKFNHIFAATSLDSQNFWAQIAVDITCRRKISARLMPNL